MFANKLVLTVDDAPTIRSFLRAILSQQGALVMEAGTGSEAVALLRPERAAPVKPATSFHAHVSTLRAQQLYQETAHEGKPQYDLILIDLLLPDMDGIQVLEQIREWNDESTVVMLTGAGGVKSATAAVRSGADGYLLKQDLSVGGELTEFFYALEQAMEHRTGLVAKKQLELVRTDFYSMVTHDLRNPAGALSTSIKMLLEGSFGELTADQKEIVTIMQDTVGNLMRLISDYLDYASIDEGYLKLELCKLELSELVGKGVALSRLQAQANQQQLIIDLPGEPINARVDGQRFKQVLDNLISNAIKYTPQGGRIIVQLRQRGDQAVLKVSDNGMGIPPRQLPALFTKYHRVPGEATRGIHGAGLGLLIVKEIVEAHGGTVKAESEGVQGKGTTFTATIPLQSETERVDQEQVRSL
jgi:signal transduction histidine kinase